jgi:GWxTD domain-containing protein
MRRFAAGLAVAWGVGCGPWQRVGAPERPQPGLEVAKLFDAATIYTRMGLLVTDAPLPSVSALRYLATSSTDSVLVVFALSLANHSLSFHREGNQFLAAYHVELVFTADSAAPVQLSSDQIVRVGGFQETLRADESVLFQGVLTLRPGVYKTSLSLRDRNSPAFARRERVDTVPRFGGPAIATPIAYYEGTGRSTRAGRPQLIVNPRATLPYGRDSLRFYVEAYGLPTGTRLAAEAFDNNDHSLWSDTVSLDDTAGFASITVRLAATALPVGEGELVLNAVGAGVRVHTPFLVSFSTEWVTTNYAEMIDLLRYFDRQDLVAKLRAATPEQRAETWREFWDATDPVPLTPENEALDAYLHRVQTANFRFRESGEPGWLTDRGEVYITLGEPDEIQDFSGAEVARGGTQVIRWTYNSLRLIVFFQDRTGFGRYELTPTSRADYLEALARVRRGQ